MYVPHIVKISVRVLEGVAQAHGEDFISPPGNVSVLYWRSSVWKESSVVETEQVCSDNNWQILSFVDGFEKTKWLHADRLCFFLFSALYI